MIDKTIKFDFETLKFSGITVKQAEFWQAVYPDVDITDQIIKKVPAWLQANEGGKGRKKNWKRFLVNWFSRAQKDAEFLRLISR